MGDIHVSRTFIKHIISTNYQETYIYFHDNPPKLLQDINFLQSVKSNDKEVKDKRGFYKNETTIYLNTWYNAHDSEFIKPHGITIHTLYHIFKKSLKNGLDQDLNHDPLYFLPEINFESFEINDIKKFVLNDKRKKVLISNNIVESSQCKNFSFYPIVEKLAEQFKDVLFIVTNKMKKEPLYTKDNITHFYKIANINDNDLNEIGYLSTFCDVIVGRFSGPQSFSYVKENLLNPSKTFITITDGNKYFKDTSFGVTDLVPKHERAKFIHYTGIDENEIVKVIGREL